MTLGLTQYTREFRGNFSLAAPVMFGQAANVFVGLVDNYMLARLGGAEGQTALAAAAAANAIFILVLLIGTGISCGMTPFISFSNASKDTGEINNILRNGFALNLAVGIAFAALLYLCAPVLALPALGQSENVAALAVPYLRIVGFSLIPVMVFLTYKQLADGLARTWPGMMAVIISNFINIAANYALIYGNWGAPKMGVEGAAWGTFISRVGLVFIMLAVFYLKPKFRPFLSVNLLKGIKARVVKKILGIGIPSGLQMLFEVGVFSAATLLAGRFGETYQAAHQIAGQMTGFTYTFVSGLAVAATIRVSYFLGKNNVSDIKRVTTSLIIMVVMIMGVFGIGYIALRETIPRFFIDSDQLVSIAAPLFLVAAAFQLFDGIQVVSQGALRGLQDVKIPTIITAAGYWAIAFPLAVLLSVTFGMKTLGIWIGLASGLIFCAVMLILRFYREVGKLQKTGNLKHTISDKSA